MTETKTNPFATSEAWAPGSGGSILGPGNYVLDVLSVDGAQDSTGGYPQLVVEFGNEDGTVKDWLVLIQSAAGKTVALIEAAGLETPTDDQVAADGPGFRIDPKYLAQFEGKKVGVVIGEEPDRNDPTKMRTRVQGYLTPDKINQELAPDTTGLGNGSTPGTASDDDIPF